MAQPRGSCLQQVNDRSYSMGITGRANRLALLMRGELGLADETLPVRVGARGPRLCEAWISSRSNSASPARIVTIKGFSAYLRENHHSSFQLPNNEVRQPKAMNPPGQVRIERFVGSRPLIDSNTEPPHSPPTPTPWIKRRTVRMIA